MSHQGARPRQVATVVESVTVLSRAIAAERRVPFQGRSLNHTQLQILYLLAHDRRVVTPKRLAVALGVTAGAITQLIDGLREEQLVRIERHPEDARSRVICLTADAAAEISVFERSIVNRLLPLFDDLSDEELRSLAGMLVRLTATL